MADQGGISDYAIQAQTRREENDSQNQGYAQLGSALGRQGGAAGTPAGEQAYEKGQSMASTTVNAMAEATLRQQEAAARDTAADFLDKNNSQIPGMDPHLATYLSAGIRGGLLRPDQALDAVKTNQENLYRSSYAGQQRDQSHAGEPGMPAYDPLMAERAAGASAPGSVAPHAIGTAGSTFSPAAASAPGAAPGAGVNISPEQHEMNQSLVNERGAQTAAAGARTTAANDPNRLHSGNRWAVDDEGTVIRNTQGTPQQEPNPAAGTAAVARRYVQNTVAAAEGIRSEVQNVSALASRDGELPSRGMTQFGGAHPGLLNTAENNLGLALSGDREQHYRSSAANLARFVQTAELNGQKPNQGTIDSMQAIINEPGTTQNQRLYNFGLIRQAVDNLHRATQVNPDATAQSKGEIRAVRDEVAKLVPYQPSDVSDFETHAKPSERFGDYLTRVKGGSSPAPGGGAAAPTTGGLPSSDDIDAELARRAGAK